MWKCGKCGEDCEDNFERCWSCATQRTPPAMPREPELIAAGAAFPLGWMGNGLGMSVPPQRPESAPAEASRQPATSSASRPALLRYTDAYRLADSTVSFGAIVKFFAFVFGIGVTCLAGFFFHMMFGAQMDSLALGYIFLGAIFGFPVFILGTLVSAQGQTLKATLDTAVCSSPFLSKEEMGSVMSLG